MTNDDAIISATEAAQILGLSTKFLHMVDFALVATRPRMFDRRKIVEIAQLRSNHVSWRDIRRAWHKPEGLTVDAVLAMPLAERRSIEAVRLDRSCFSVRLYNCLRNLSQTGVRVTLGWLASKEGRAECRRFQGVGTKSMAELEELLRALELPGVPVREPAVSVPIRVVSGILREMGEVGPNGLAPLQDELANILAAALLDDVKSKPPEGHE